MEGDLSVLIMWGLLVIGLLLLDAFFVAGEASLLHGRRDLIAQDEVHAQSIGSRWAISLLERLDYHILTVRFGLTVVNLLLGLCGVRFLYGLSFYVVGHNYGELMAVDLPSSVGMIAFGLLVIAAVHVIFSDLVIRHISLRHAELVLSFIAGPILVMSWFFRPLTATCVWMANIVLGVCGVSSAKDVGRVHSANELARLIAQSTASGELDKGEEEMLHGVFGFSDTVAREVMTPRPDLITVALGDSLDEIVHTIVESGHSRFPVVDDSIDNVVGVLLAKDIMPLFADGLKQENKRECSDTREAAEACGKDIGLCHSIYDSFEIRSVIRECYFIPGSKPIDDLLNEFKLRKLHMAIVLDEHGGVDGVVTLEDLIEEIVGEIYDESDVAESSIVIDSNGDALVDGGMLVADINDRFDMQIPEGDYDTIAGFIFSTLGRVPVVGDAISISHDGRIEIDCVSVGRIGGQESNGQLSDASSSELPRSNTDNDDVEKNSIDRIIIKVEQVDGNRIETVRFCKLSGVFSVDSE